MAGMRSVGFGRGVDRSKCLVKVVIAAHPGSVAESVNRSRIAFIKVKTHLPQARREPARVEFAVSNRLAGVNDQHGAPLLVLNLFSTETFDGSHWAVALRTLLDSRLV